jgi:hypothetical protein
MDLRIRRLSDFSGSATGTLVGADLPVPTAQIGVTKRDQEGDAAGLAEGLADGAAEPEADGAADTDGDGAADADGDAEADGDGDADGDGEGDGETYGVNAPPTPKSIP